MTFSPANIRNILFVCAGNICRSPMAEWQLKALLWENPITGMQVGSAGLIALPGNSASFNAVRVARENSVSLEEHKARPITTELIDNADLVLVMESHQGHELINDHPQASEKILLLRHFARYGSRERGISDPYGRNLEAYRFCFEDIKECVESLYEWLVEANQPN
ncbi:MAG: low molecular weight protein arginine phosphatase [Deltaproteobacteria bacterium]|nr:low molecular weight protein arginine phosphatase [Deltaproteobacteria bacterium]